MTTNYERAMAEFEATLTPEERALEAAIVADFDFAREVVSLRTALGITQSELAARTGVPQSELSRIEHGRLSRPSLVDSASSAVSARVSPYAEPVQSACLWRTPSPRE